jgi:cytochrome c556
MKTDIRFTAILVVAALSLAFCGAAEAAYKIVLTNGSVLIVDSYREDDGMITADYAEGTISFDRDLVRSITETTDLPKRLESPQPEKSGEAASPAQPAVTAGQAEKEQQKKERIARLDELNGKIAEKREGIKTLQADRIALVEQIDALKKTARDMAIANFQDPGTVGYSNLNPNDRKWLLDNQPKVAELDWQIKQFREDLSSLLDELSILEKK